MRFFEFASPAGASLTGELDQDSARSVFAVIKGLADKHRMDGEIPFPAVMNYINQFNLGISTPDALRQFKDAIDPNGAVIKDVLDDGTIILNTREPNDRQSDEIDQGSSPTLDQMASRQARRTLGK